MKQLLQKSYLIFIFLLLYIPLVILMLYSVNSAKFSLQWQQFSMQWYYTLWQDNTLWATFGHSIILGITAAGGASLLGFLACLHLFFNPKQQSHIFHSLILILITLPDLVFGIAFVIFFNVFNIQLGFMSLLIAHITFCLPFVILTLQSRMYNLDRNIYFSALDLGASRMYAICHVLLPILRQTLIGAFLLAFTLSFDDIVISYFVAGPDFNILPLTIYSLVRAGVTPELNALCTITVILSMVLIAISHHLARKQS